MNASGILSFLSQLKENNNKDWFESNRKTYAGLRKEFEEFVGDLLKELARFEPEMSSLQVKDCMFRINRDIRFSKDKTPYKGNFSAFFTQGGKKAIKAGYYFHLEPGNNSMIAGGIYMPPNDQLNKIRQEIDYNTDRFKEILAEDHFKKYYQEIHGEKLKSIPKGYPKDHPEIEFLKFKSYTVSYPLTDKQIKDGKLLENVSDGFNAMKYFCGFLNHALE